MIGEPVLLPTYGYISTVFIKYLQLFGIVKHRDFRVIASTISTRSSAAAAAVAVSVVDLSHPMETSRGRG